MELYKDTIERLIKQNFVTMMYTLHVLKIIEL